MSENNVQQRSLSEKVFGAEKNSAASLSQGKLSKYNQIAIRMFHTGVLTPKEMAFPAVAEFATRLLSGITYYRTLYFVNVLKIDMVYVTVILTLISIYDILNNPLMGAVYDRTRTRWGKARPYIIFTAIPYFLSTAVLYSGALFLGDKAGNDPKKIIFVFEQHNAFAFDFNGCFTGFRYDRRVNIAACCEGVNFSKIPRFVRTPMGEFLQ